MPARSIVAAVLLVGGVAHAGSAPDPYLRPMEDRDAWEVDGSFGLAVLTYPSAAAIPTKPMPRLVYLIPPTGGGVRCPMCVSTSGAGEALMVSRWLGPVLRATAVVDFSRNNRYDVSLYGAAVGIGFGANMGIVRLIPHFDMLLGVDHFSGVATDTDIQLTIAMGLDFWITHNITAGLESKMRTLHDGPGSPGWAEFGLRLGVRWH